MNTFSAKKLAPVERLCERLRKRREELKLDLKHLAGKTRISSRFLDAIEAGQFSKLPRARAHRLAYIKEYAGALELPVEECVDQFTAEGGLNDIQQVHPHQSITIFPFSSVSIFLRNTILLSGVALFIGYLALQVRSILEPPMIAVFSPAEGYVYNQPVAMIFGETEKETHLTINGRDIMVNEQGRFETKVDLSAGINTIVITATKKHGKSTTITRHVIAKSFPNGEIISYK